MKMLFALLCLTTATAFGQTGLAFGTLGRVYKINL